jgi:hypothetical protein
MKSGGPVVISRRKSCAEAREQQIHCGDAEGDLRVTGERVFADIVTSAAPIRDAHDAEIFQVDCDGHPLGSPAGSIPLSSGRFRTR